MSETPPWTFESGPLLVAEPKICIWGGQVYIYIMYNEKCYIHNIFIIVSQ